MFTKLHDFIQFSQCSLKFEVIRFNFKIVFFSRLDEWANEVWSPNGHNQTYLAVNSHFRTSKMAGLHCGNLAESFFEQFNMHCCRVLQRWLVAREILAMTTLANDCWPPAPKRHCFELFGLSVNLKSVRLFSQLLPYCAGARAEYV